MQVVLTRIPTAGGSKSRIVCRIYCMGKGSLQLLQYMTQVLLAYGRRSLQDERQGWATVRLEAYDADRPTAHDTCNLWVFCTREGQPNQSLAPWHYT